MDLLFEYGAFDAHAAAHNESEISDSMITVVRMQTQYKAIEKSQCVLSNTFLEMHMHKSECNTIKMCIK